MIMASSAQKITQVSQFCPKFGLALVSNLQIESPINYIHNTKVDLANNCFICTFASNYTKKLNNTICKNLVLMPLTIKQDLGGFNLKYLHVRILS